MIEQVLNNIRDALLAEARHSPGLLSDLAGLEQYVAESYDARSFIELLQNADDAGASRFAIHRAGNLLIVANNGRCFTQADFESLCRSAASTKSRGESIGYRGIGFKSVVGFARTIHLVSGDLAVTFSRERTALEVPKATRVPLVRIPHPLEQSDHARFAAMIDTLSRDGLSTAFVFDGLVADGIEKEFAAFDPSAMLFLRSVQHVELQTDTKVVISASRQMVDARTRKIEINSNGNNSQWLLIEQDDVAVGLQCNGKRVEKLNEREAVVHAFLPTHEPTGLAVKLHGDISTDPSRTRVVFDERTAAGIDQMARLLVELLEQALSGTMSADPVSVVEAIMPLSDPRMAAFQRRSFKSDLMAAMQRCADGRFNSLRCRPAWLNLADFETLSLASEVRSVPRRLDCVNGLNGFLRYLGAKEASFDEISASIHRATVSVQGAAEIVSYLTKQYVTKSISTKQIDQDWPLWPVGGQLLSFKQVRESTAGLDDGFIDRITEQGGIHSELKRMVTDISNPATADILIPLAAPVRDEASGEASQDRERNTTSRLQPLSLKRWRSAEQQVANLLVAQGWVVEDVSRQNIGYDLDAVSSDGEHRYVEVKAIDHGGQAFILTSNEEAVAREKGGRYELAIVRQTSDVLEVAFIRDPAKQLNMTRQCRQWVWECSDYQYTPQRFPLE